MRHYYLLPFLFACLLPVTTVAWESSLYPYDATASSWQRPVLTFNERSWQLPDFSHVGYQSGEAALANGLTCFNRTVDTTGNFADALEQAIDDVVQSGGGTVRIPAGDFVLERSVSIADDNISIVGAGSDLTRIHVPASYDPSDDFDEGLFTFGKPIGGWHKGWVDRGNELARVSEPVAAGSRLIRVEDSTELQIGQEVVVTQYYWLAFSQRNSNGQWAFYNGFPASGANRESAFVYLRQITDISGTQVTLDAPIPHRLDPANNPVRLRDTQNPSWIRPRRNVGIAGISIRFDNNQAAADGRPAGSGVYFEGVHDGWVYDVQIENFPRFGILLSHSAAITIRDSAVREAQDYGDAGYGYGINIYNAQRVLVQRTYIADTRHGITARSSLSNDLVFSQTESAQAREGGDDVHYGFVHNVLWDKHGLTWGTGLHGIYRGTTSGGAHEANGSKVLWNVSGDGHRGGWYGGSIQLNPSSDGWNIMVGGPAGHEVWDTGAELGSGEQMHPAAGLQTGNLSEAAGPGSRDANVLYEGLGQAGLTPSSLYLAQLQQRLASLPADFDNSCGWMPQRGTVAPRIRPGDDQLIFDSDHLGFTPMAGSGCLQCDFDSSDAAGNGTGEGILLSMSASNWAIGATLRGPLLDTSDYSALSLWLNPAQPDTGLRLRLSRNGLPESNPQTLGDHVLSGLAQGWQRIEIPLSEFGSGTFNTVEIRSTGNNSARRIDLDDILLITAAPPPKQCNDGVDNDSDGLIDYPADPGCESASDDDEFNAPPPPPKQCADGIDNDGDGLIDYPADPGCDSESDDDEFNAPPPPPKQCADGIDNDGDGLVDYPADPGCESESDDDEFNEPPPPPKQCADGIDNDGDGLVDYPNDPGCESEADDDEFNAPPPPPQCSDGVDNDGDGLVDGDDPGCTGPDDDKESPKNCRSKWERLTPPCLFR